MTEMKLQHPNIQNDEDLAIEFINYNLENLKSLFVKINEKVPDEKKINKFLED